MIYYLQEEQKKRWEELRALERDLEKLQADPKYQQLLKLVEKMKNEPVAEQYKHGVVVRCVRRGRRSLAVRDMPVTLGHVRLHGPAPVPLTSPPFFWSFLLRG